MSPQSQTLLRACNMKNQVFKNGYPCKALKATITELNQLVVESPKYWAKELAVWAVGTLAGIGSMLGSLYPQGNLAEVTQFWLNQEVTEKLHFSQRNRFRQR